MGGTRTMAQGFNPTMADGHPSGGGLQYSKCDAGDGKFSMQDLHCFIRATIVISLSLLEAQPPAALFPGFLTQPLTPYFFKDHASP